MYSINIIYFDLGKGDDYVYHGFTNFTGLHTQTELELTNRQQQLYGKTVAGDLYPEYYIIKVSKFNEVAKDTLDEWIFYLKTGKIRDDFTAQGIDKARKVLAYDNLTDADKKQHEGMVHDRRIRDSEIRTAFSDGESKGEAKGLEKGKAEGKAEVVLNAHNAGYSTETISAITGLTAEQIIKIQKFSGLTTLKRAQK